MQKHLCGISIESTQHIKKTRTASRLAVIGLAIALTLGTTSRSYADDTPGGNRDKIAEMTALARHNERCAAVPREWAAAYLILLTMSPPTEEQVLAKEREMLALSSKLGNKKWCQLYSAEMEQAHIIYRLATQR